NVENMSRMFSSTSAFNQNIGSWNVSNVMDMGGMFNGASSFNQNIGSWNVSNVTSMARMFQGASAFNQPLSSWNMSEVTGIAFMFFGATSFNQDLSTWDVSKVSNMIAVFQLASSFDQSLASWDISSVNDMSEMLSGSVLSTDNYDNTLIGWNRLDPGETQIPANIALTAVGLTYCTAAAERQFLIDTYGWLIFDNGLGCAGLPLNVKVFLQGPYNTATGLHNDGLRSNNLIPNTEPYTALSGFTHVNGGGETVDPAVLAITGNDAIVDWVFVELRDANDPTVVLDNRSALLQRDGDIVEVTSGTDPLIFTGVTPGAYYVAVRHRNHLGIRTPAALSLSTSATSYDFTTNSSQAHGTEPMEEVSTGIWAMWGGNTTGDNAVRVTGPPFINDYSNLLNYLGGPTNIQFGVYVRQDINMDGNVRVTGPPTINDYSRLLSILGSVTRILFEQL
ncbi:MAG: BspA family leucine-rich repeat surface protein, partial [Bacteroidota bacterium]